MRLVFLFLFLLLNNSFAESRHPDFITPLELRPRVDFWIDIFTRYGKNQTVYHHRDYPQAIFDVLDVSDLERSVSGSKFTLEKMVKKAKENKVKEIESAFRDIIAGRESGALGRKIKDAMELVPGGDEKYRDVLEKNYIRGQTGIKEKHREAIARSGRYLPIIEKIFKKEGLPLEVTRMPFIESSFDYQAYSSVGAAGIWQFMRSTAKNYMTVNSLIDERRDVISASHAAAKYLKNAYSTLGSWPLAVMSYNHGVGGVKKKVNALGIRDIVEIVEHPKERPFAFASNNFYPELLAAIEVYMYHDDYFPDVEVEPALKIAEYKMRNATSIGHIKKRLGITIEELKKYNYAVSDQIWRGAYKMPAGYVLKVPAEYKIKLVTLNAPEPTSGSSSVVYGVGTHKVRSGENLGRIASRYGITVSTLKKLNNLKSNKIYAGQVLIVNPQQRTTTAVKATPASSLTATYKVKSGDSLWSISKKYGVSLSKLKSLNNIKGSNIRVGQRLRLQ